MAKIGFIGMGNMGHAILKGALKEYPAEEMIFCAKTSETKTKVHAETGVEYTDNNAECANRCKYLQFLLSLPCLRNQSRPHTSRP